VTFFKTTDITVQRLNKAHLISGNALAVFGQRPDKD
jgi:hypothetical protein